MSSPINTNFLRWWSSKIEPCQASSFSLSVSLTLKDWYIGLSGHKSTFLTPTFALTLNLSSIVSSKITRSHSVRDICHLASAHSYLYSRPQQKKPRISTLRPVLPVPLTNQAVNIPPNTTGLSKRAYSIPFTDNYPPSTVFVSSIHSFSWICLVLSSRPPPRWLS